MATDTKSRLIRQTRLLGAAVVTSALLCGMTLRGSLAARAELQTRRAGAVALAADAAVIQERRAAPVTVAAGFQEGDLLQRIETATQHAGLPAEALRSTLPEPPRRARGASHAEVITRLQFEDVSLEQISRFCARLAEVNPEISVRAIDLTAGRNDRAWRAAVSVGYFVATD